VSFQTLDVVVLNTDLPARGLKRGDLGAVVDSPEPDAIDGEFVTASGRTKALIPLKSSDLREVADDDLVSVRPTGASPKTPPGADGARDILRRGSVHIRWPRL